MLRGFTRRPSASTILIVAMLALAACSTVGTFESSSSPAIDLSGTWKLNRAASDDPAKLFEKMRERQRQAPPPAASDGDESEAGLPGGSGQQRRTSSDAPYDGRRPQRQHDSGLAAEVERQFGAGRGILRIRQSATEVAIDNGTHLRKFTPGGHSVVSVPGGVADQSSGWDGREFVIDTSGRNRPQIVERYALSADRSQLIVAVKINGRGELPNMEFRRVYDSAPGSAVEPGPTS
ncbi:MAG TPA: hypothetical protein VE046_15495 [Steroidobacteraceae bacterium]|nr:hypothetical protein [Steroidobacteraceae bacterium]